MTGSLPTEFQRYIHLSRYARYLDDKKRRETWPETVQRYVDFMTSSMRERLGFEVDEFMRADIHNAILNLEVLPSMRALMTAGPAAGRENVAMYNCSYIAIDHVRAFDEILYILMCGTGVGFSVERQEISRLPAVPEGLVDSDETIVVPDSKQGWAEALRKLLASLYAGWVPKIDYSRIRPKGARLKVFGGRASGPEPLKRLFEYAIKLFTKAQGRQLESIECHDLVCMIADIVVVGGVRRAALISLSNLSDMRMRDAKSGQWWETNVQRARSNNSVAFTEKPEVGHFMQEWLALYQSKSGERGIFNREAAKEKCREVGRDADRNFGTNPCVTGDTPILTKDGYRRIQDTVGHNVVIWDGREWVLVEPFSTGHNDTLTVHLSDGTSLTCTDYHKWLIHDGEEKRVETRYLKPGDKLAKYDMPVVGDEDFDEEQTSAAYSQGFYSADGNKDQKFSWVPLEEHSLRYRLEWFAGLMDGDGTVVRYDNSDSLQLSSVDKAFLLDVRLLLTSMGVQAKLELMNPAASGKAMPGGSYDTQDCWRLIINSADTQKLLDCGIEFRRLKVQKGTVQRDARRFVKVVSVERAERQETFCFHNPVSGRGTFNGIVTAQCGEIILRSKGFCNLTEVVARSGDTEEDLFRKIQIATILGTWQSSFTDFRYIRPKWKQNAEEERLLGVSITGIMDCELLQPGAGGLSVRLAAFRDFARQVNRKEAQLMGINPSAAITCVKPSGTASSLADASSGIHRRFAERYIRRVRNDIKDPLTQFMVDQGFPAEVDIMNEDNMVFSFPMEAPEGSDLREYSAIEQLEFWLAYRRHWCDHNPSTTVYVKEDEWPAVGGWVYEHFDEVGGLSFLPVDGGTYMQMPYEAVSAEKLKELQDVMPGEVDWTALIEHTDETSGSQEYACVAGSCALD